MEEGTKEAAVAIGSSIESTIPNRPNGYICPECQEAFGTPELLAPHIERHSPVRKPIRVAIGKATRCITILCAKGCGRAFINETLRGYRIETLVRKTHEEICDGSEPLPMAAPRPEIFEAREMLPPPQFIQETQQPEERTMAKAKEELTCEICHQTGFKSGQALGQHRRHQHAGAKPPKKRQGAPAAGTPADDDGADPALTMLEAQLEECDERIAAANKTLERERKRYENLKGAIAVLKDK